MKKIMKLLVVAVTSALLSTSCDLNTFPENSLDNDTALLNMSDLVKWETGSYAVFRANYTPALIVAEEIQADYVNAVFGFGNVYGNMQRWDYTYADYDVADTWAALYKTVAQVTYVIDYAPKIERTEADLPVYNRVIGTMHLMRAMSFHDLALKFCATYDSATATQPAMGLPLPIVFDSNAKPTRETMQATYDQILSDIATARTLLTTPGAPNSTVLTVDCITALEARVYLQMKDYPKAFAAANTLIAKYPLATTKADINKMWAEDKGTEVIFVPFASLTELPPQYGFQFIVDQNSKDDDYRPNYIPTQKLLDMYDDADFRKEVYFLKADGTCTIGGNKIASPIFLMNKYPGNTSLRTVATSKNYVNAFKVFRVAEMYLIAAEAGANGAGDAKTPLNTLRAARNLPALGTVTMTNVKEERVREMMFEGNRITDLKRWGDTLMARTGQTGTLDTGAPAQVITPGADYDQLTVAVGDYRFVWPIPSEEIYANQKLAPQQNPGWEK